MSHFDLPAVRLSVLPVILLPLWMGSFRVMAQTSCVFRTRSADGAARFLAVLGPEDGALEHARQTASKAGDAAGGQGGRVDDRQRAQALIHDMEKMVRKAYPEMSPDESEALRRSLQAVLLDPNTSLARTEPNRILQCLEPTLADWKFAKPNQFAWFVATTQWVLREYFAQKGRPSAEALRTRQRQREWQKAVALGLVDRMAEGVGKGQKVDPRTEELIQTLVQDLQREMENPLNPFFRPPLPEEQWQRYCTRVEEMIQRELARLKAQLEKIDRAFEEEEQAKSVRERLGDILHQNRYAEEYKKVRKWLAYQGFVELVAGAVVQDYCMANFPPLDSPRFAPWRIRGVGVSYGLGSVVWVGLQLRQE